MFGEEAIMLTVTLRLEQIGTKYLGWIDMYPGAHCYGTTADEAAQNAPTALLDYFQWLSKHGEPISGDLLTLNVSDVHVEVVETFLVRDTSGGKELPASFTSEAPPLGEAEIARYLQMLGYTNADLHDAANTLTPEKWDEAPSGVPPARVMLDDLCESCVTLLTLTLMIGSDGKQRYDGSVAKHIRETEDKIIHREGLSSLTVEGSDPQVRLARWEALHEVLLQAVRDVPPDKHNVSFTLHEEQWTLRKVLRHALWHERYYGAQIAATPEEYFSAFYPEVTDYLDWLDMTFYKPDFYPVWTKTILDLTDLIGPDTDPDWQRLKSILIGYYEGENVSEEEVRNLHQEITRVRGGGWWGDNSVLGLKYRCLNAIYSTKDYSDIQQWMYGIWTAVELINHNQSQNDIIIRRIQDALTAAQGAGQ